MACTQGKPDTEAGTLAMELRCNESDRLRAKGMAVALKEQPREAYVSALRKKLPPTEAIAQKQCPLFQKLPSELRLHIWQAVFETPCTRLERWRPIYILEQLGDSRDALDADCFPYRLLMTGHLPIQHLLGLILSCRRIYCEAVPALYSTHRFNFTDVRDLLSFQQTTSPIYLNSIRNLTIVLESVDRKRGDLFVPNTKNAAILKRWERVCHCLCTMSLTSLQIWLYRMYGDYQESHRPWMTTSDQGEMDELEERHQNFFALLNRVKVDEYQVHLNWWPEDVFAEGQWSFTPQFASAQEIQQVIADLPRPAYEGLYD
ncbi:MAG: hypothetical protein Q9160_006238 [Pyrenula sp. 1 TL-2023]